MCCWSGGGGGRGPHSQTRGAVIFRGWLWGESRVLHKCILTLPPPYPSHLDLLHGTPRALGLV